MVNESSCECDRDRTIKIENFGTDRYTKAIGLSGEWVDPHNAPSASVGSDRARSSVKGNCDLSGADTRSTFAHANALATTGAN
jgi:hypothetical protein